MKKSPRAAAPKAAKEPATARFYRDMYSKTSYAEGIGDERVAALRAEVRRWMKVAGTGPKASVLEVGAGHGDLHDVHQGWRGIEYSSVAVAQGRKKYGAKCGLEEGDATRMNVKSGAVDFLFTFACLEHVPGIEEALLEILRVLKPGGFALIAPAWNCRPWTVEKLQQRPYAELNLRQKLGKFLIPLREHLLFRMALAMPKRLWRELKLLRGKPIGLDYQPLQPQWELFKKYPHISDDDAFVNVDAHAVICYYLSRGVTVVSHRGFLKRLLCRAESVVIKA